MQKKERKSALLSAIIQDHVESGNTVASSKLVDKVDFKVSPATIRNDMSALEREGFILQPHTSAGRIPTEKGWKYYIENYLEEKPLDKKSREMLDTILKAQDESYEGLVKKVAKQLAEMSKQAVFVGFNRENFYYTGLSNLFNQPEFEKIDLVRHISGVVDHMDEVLRKIYDTIGDDVEIKVGEENPFGTECSSIVSAYHYGDRGEGLFGILGPMRMNYDNNLALIKHAKELFAKA